jgi:hypothetical protein
MIEIKHSENYAKNQSRNKDNAYPCIICGKSVNNPKHFVRLFYGATVVMETEARAIIEKEGEGGDMLYYPVGSDCLKKHPELKPYVEDAARVSKEIDDKLAEAHAAGGDVSPAKGDEDVSEKLELCPYCGVMVHDVAAHLRAEVHAFPKDFPDSALVAASQPPADDGAGDMDKPRRLRLGDTLTPEALGNQVVRQRNEIRQQTAEIERLQAENRRIEEERVKACTAVNTKGLEVAAANQRAEQAEAAAAVTYKALRHLSMTLATWHKPDSTSEITVSPTFSQADIRQWLDDAVDALETNAGAALLAERDELKAFKDNLLYTISLEEQRIGELQDERDSLRAKVDAAKKALKPFADTWKVYIDMYAYAYGSLGNFLTDHADEEDIEAWFKAAAALAE